MPTEITTRTTKVWLDGRIMHVAIQPGAEEDLADAEANIRAIASLCEEKKRCPLFVDFRSLKSQSRDARMYYAGPETARVACAVALMVSSPLSRVLANFFMGLNKPLMPIRVFTDESAARAWLMEHVE